MAVSPVGAAVAARAFAPIAGSVADVGSQPAVFLNHPPAGPIVDAPDPVSVVVSGVPGFVSCKAFPAAADISDPRWDFPCLSRGAGGVAGHSGELL